MLKVTVSSLISFNISKKAFSDVTKVVDQVLFKKKAFFQTARFFLFFCIISIIVWIILFSLIIILIRCSVIDCSLMIIFIYVKSILFIIFAIKTETEIWHKCTILPVISTNNKIFKSVKNWEKKKTFNKFSKQAIVKIGSRQVS